jgi:syntaxin-binding protein 5
MGNGDLRTYDLACMQKSPYAVRNMWQIHEEQRLKAGITSVPLRNPLVLNTSFTYFLKPTRVRKPQAVEILLHPRDLALVFIAYDGEYRHLHCSVK